MTAQERRMFVLAATIAIVLTALFVLLTTHNTTLLPVHTAPGGTPETGAIALAAPPVQPGQPNPALDIYNVELTARVSAGMPPLAHSAPLTASAQAYALALSKVPGQGPGIPLPHTGVNGSTYITRDEAAGYVGWHALGEIIGWGYGGSATAVVQGWMVSPTHKVVLTNPAYKDTGIAAVQVPGSYWNWYYVQEFGALP